MSGGRTVEHRWRHAVCGEDEDRPGRGIGLVLDEDRTSPFEVVDDMRVVDDLLAHVDGRSVEGKRVFHRLDGTLYSRTVTPG